MRKCSRAFSRLLSSAYSSWSVRNARSAVNKYIAHPELASYTLWVQPTHHKVKISARRPPAECSKLTKVAFEILRDTASRPSSGKCQCGAAKKYGTSSRGQINCPRKKERKYTSVPPTEPQKRAA